MISIPHVQIPIGNVPERRSQTYLSLGKVLERAHVPALRSARRDLEGDVRVARVVDVEEVGVELDVGLLRPRLGPAGGGGQGRVRRHLDRRVAGDWGGGGLEDGRQDAASGEGLQEEEQTMSVRGSWYCWCRRAARGVAVCVSEAAGAWVLIGGFPTARRSRGAPPSAHPRHSAPPSSSRWSAPRRSCRTGGAKSCRSSHDDSPRCLTGSGLTFCVLRQLLKLPSANWIRYRSGLVGTYVSRLGRKGSVAMGMSRNERWVRRWCERRRD